MTLPSWIIEERVHSSTLSITNFAHPKNADMEKLNFQEKPCVEVYDKEVFFICSVMLIKNSVIINRYLLFINYTMKVSKQNKMLNEPI
jgi:hypothetical protein